MSDEEFQCDIKAETSMMLLYVFLGYDENGNINNHDDAIAHSYGLTIADLPPIGSWLKQGGYAELITTKYFFNDTKEVKLASEKFEK